eukprot:9471565-Pyramimonas_sp.AAC.2
MASPSPNLRRAPEQAAMRRGSTLAKRREAARDAPQVRLHLVCCQEVRAIAAPAFLLQDPLHPFVELDPRGGGVWDEHPPLALERELPVASRLPSDVSVEIAAGGRVIIPLEVLPSWPLDD